MTLLTTLRFVFLCEITPGGKGFDSGRLRKFREVRTKAPTSKHHKSRLARRIEAVTVSKFPREEVSKENERSLPYTTLSRQTQDSLESSTVKSVTCSIDGSSRAIQLNARLWRFPFRVEYSARETTGPITWIPSPPRPPWRRAIMTYSKEVAHGLAEEGGLTAELFDFRRETLSLSIMSNCKNNRRDLVLFFPARSRRIKGNYARKVY